MRKLLSLLLSAVLVFSVVTTVVSFPAEATSLKKKNKALTAYKNWLVESDCVGFRLFDVNGDGTKELLTTYDGYGKNVYNIGIYTYKNGSVASCNDYQSEYSMFGFSNNKITKRLHGSRGGGGSEEQWYYNLTKNKMLKKVSLIKVENGYNYTTDKMTYRYYFNNKEITHCQRITIFIMFFVRFFNQSVNFVVFCIFHNCVFLINS